MPEDIPVGAPVSLEFFSTIDSCGYCVVHPQGLSIHRIH